MVDDEGDVPDAGSVAAAGAVAVAEGLAGIFSFCPTVIRSVFRWLAARRALTVVPFPLAMELRLSPDFTE